MGKRIRAQRKGSSPRYRVSSHRFPGANRMPRDMDVVGEVTELVHSPVHTAPLARVKLPDGDTTLVVATEGVAIGSKIAIGDNVSLRPGNITPLSEIPEGTAINNVELRPGDGGKVARSAGNSCVVEAKLGDKVRIRMPSGSLKELQAPAEPPLVFSQDMVETRCHYELQVQLTTRQRLVVNSSRMLAVLP